MADLKKIEELAKDYSDADRALTNAKQKCERALAEVQGKHRDIISSCVANCIKAKEKLDRETGKNPELFNKPKSQIFFGIKLGLKKEKDVLVLEHDDDKTVKLIRKHIPEEEADLYIKTTEKPLVSALQGLDGKTLVKLGAKWEYGQDAPFSKSVDTMVDKFIQALMKD